MINPNLSLPYHPSYHPQSYQMNTRSSFWPLLILYFLFESYQLMSKKFQYNFTNENELLQLRERIYELEEENNLLKQSLQELIKVNTELTESIEEFNQDNGQNEYQSQQINQMAQTIQALNNELDSLRKEVEYANYERSKTSKKASEVQDQHEAQSLVNVLEELIESFKSMQNRYDGEMSQFQKTFEQYKNSYEYSLKKLEEQYQQKLNTIEPVMMQLTRKDENFKLIMQKMAQLEGGGRGLKESNGKENVGEVRRTYEAKLEEKNKVISYYQNLLEKLKVKFSERL